MSKTYFQYQGVIRSQAVAEAISFPVGIGPFMGFARVDLSSSTIYPDPQDSNINSNQSKFYDKSIQSQNYAHCVGFNPSDPNRYKFGLITKSGHIYVSEATSLPITVFNSGAGRSELIVMALYKNIEEPITNIPTLVGYWNNSNSSFYNDFFLNTIQSSSTALGTEIKETFPKTYSDLYDRVRTIIGDTDYESNMVLIGIYGEGINPETKNSETFSIVPYGSRYPYSQPFTPSMFYTLKGAIDGINNFLGPGASNHNNLEEYIKSLLPTKSEEPAAALDGVPIGTIVMWTGTKVPDGWVICDGTNGTPDLRDRFPIGASTNYPLNGTGGSKEVTLSVDQLPAHDHMMNSEWYKWGDNNHWVPVPTKNGKDKNIEGVERFTQDTGKGQPINIMNPWCAVHFIMRIE